MRIQHNIMAMSAYRNYTNNVSAMQKNLEKLSSGYKINRAGDDAAGLAISEKMRAQITGLETAQKNAKDGISLVQTAEGALTEVHDMLNRMVELATQSANGTYDNETDRAQLQKELDQLKTEIDRIADSSNFNGIQLLDGSMAISDAVEASSTTTAVDVSGADRIIQSVIEKGEKAYEVAGNKTILDGNGAPAQKAVFEIDLKTMNFNVSGAGGSVAATASTTTYALDKTSISVADGAGTVTADIVISSQGAVSLDNVSGADGTGLSISQPTWASASATTATCTITGNGANGATVNETVTVTRTITPATAGGTTALASGAINSTVTVKIGSGKNDVLSTGSYFAVTASEAAASTAPTSEDLAKKIAQAMLNNAAGAASATSATVSINGVDWTMKVDGTKLVFEQVENPKTADEARANFDVSINITQKGDTSTSNNVLTIDLGETKVETKASGNTLSMSASIKAGTYVKTAGVAEEDANKANTIFNIKESDLTDGTQIAIGTKTIVLSVGGDSQVKAADYDGAKVVKLGADDDLNTALSKISNEIGNTVNLKILGENGSVQTVEFQIGVSDSSQGFPSGLAIQRVTSAATDGKPAFDTLDKLAQNFKMRVNETTTTEAKEATKGLTLQIGDTAEDFNQLTVSIGDCHASAIGIGDVDISTQEGATAAIEAIKNAINYVSDVRGTLGATQNRLDHTINNLSVMTENIQDAESTIRDVDVAEEMMAYTKNNILIQSAQAMLAQANQVPQGVLQLLQ